MGLKAKCGLAGRVVGWSVVDRKGRVTRKGGPSHNMILDQALDDFIAEDGLPNVHSFASNTAWGIMRYLAVGTSSTAPAETQTALGSEVGRTLQQYDTGDLINDGLSDGAGKYRLRKYFEFDFEEVTGNLTEFGVSPSNTGKLCTRELFRDEEDNPVTITVTDDEKLRVVYEFEVVADPATATAFNFTLEVDGTPETRSGVWSFLGVGSYNAGYRRASLAGVGRTRVYATADGNPSWTSPGVSGASESTGNDDGTVDPYTSGDRKRTRTMHVGTDKLNQTIAALQWYHSSQPMWVAHLDSGDEINKTGDDVLELDIFEFSWDRVGAS